MTTVANRQLRVTAYAPDKLSDTATALRVAGFGAAGGGLALAAWFVLHSISFASFNTSMVTRALATMVSLLLVLMAAACVWGWLRGTKNLLLEAVATLVPAGIVVSSLGIPLATTTLWLDGIQVDQGFRTQFLSRMTETASHADMNYVDLPTFYPMGWFWLGGRMANVLGMAGWEVYQPWALVSLAAAAATLTPIWRKITGSLPVAAAIALVTTAIVLTEVPDEPYAAVVAMFIPAAAIGAYKALSGSWFATICLAIYLGISATFYTLFTAIGALTVVVLALVLCFANGRALTPIKHLVIIGGGSILIALISWGPYLVHLLFGGYETRSTANHFLPYEGTYFPLPFFSLSIIGLLSLIGLIYLVCRINEPEVLSLALAILVCYVWAAASMAITLLGTSLLGFRVEALLILLFATAGVLGIADVRLVGVDYLYPARFGERANNAITAVTLLLVAAGSLFYVQQIPEQNERHIDQAYADTDGNGHRADLRSPDAGRYYADIVAYLSEHGRTPTEAVIYTDEINFMAYNPYYGFNAFTSHYANPLGEFDLRNQELAGWAKLSDDDPDALTAAIDASQWRGPEAFIFRGELGAGTPYKTHIAHDIFPSQPNVRYEALFFNPDAFDNANWDATQIGPFVVVVRK
ncbi:galactan 5-O-arabinofuranosyltransferase [Corynebacterium sp. TA-R-1]|uniref:Galactan 5-O-arabinofuranosyltransferase n=1 Tax=Corynebacterium stercoris TaxID=2943490 RepID=A0ABT1G537_9CORY|nr:galactan 5-O-arabinofuranosyltransferase [Corynebacterium stercoris]MCP1388143.1 galactan 5-O-arabinofuranosyltransferase [Corynebacterium stercoris]